LIEVRKIDGHGKRTGVAQGEALNQPKLAPTIVDPDFVRGMEVVADIQIRVPSR
jgi:hypothetical protein